jgi:hypothetical protein
LMTRYVICAIWSTPCPVSLACTSQASMKRYLPTRPSLHGLFLWQMIISDNFHFTLTWPRVLQKQLRLHEVLDKPSWRFMFPNLTSLVLEDCDLDCNLLTLWRFLRRTPAISRLVLNSCQVCFFLRKKD